MQWQNTGLWHAIQQQKQGSDWKFLPVQKIRFEEDSDGIFEDKLQKKRTGHFTKKIWIPTKSWNWLKRVHNWKNGTTVDELPDPVSQKDQKQMYLSTQQIPKVMVLTQCSNVQIIHCDLSRKCLVHLLMWLMPRPIASFPYIYILQRSVVTQLKCSEIFNNRFIVNCPESVLVKEFWKSVNILWKYRNNKVWHFLKHGVQFNRTIILAPNMNECAWFKIPYQQSYL